MFLVKNLRFKQILDIPYLLLDRPIVCIAGASGSGKTTFLRMLNRLNVPDEGTVLYNGQDLTSMDTIKLRRNVVMLGQTPVIYSGTVEDNLQIGLRFSQKPPADTNMMKEIISRLELKIALDAHCQNLSGGEKQRLCLARVMLMDAETYLLDEPSAALDSKTERIIVDVLADFVRKKNKQLVMISHSGYIAQLFQDSVVRIDNGRVVEVYDE